MTVWLECDNNIERATECILNMESGQTDEMLARQLAQSEYSGDMRGTGFGNTAPFKRKEEYVHSVQLENIDSTVMEEILGSVKSSVVPLMLKQLSAMTIPKISEQIDAGKLGVVDITVDQVKVSNANVPEESIDISVDKSRIRIKVQDISASLQQFQWSYDKHSFPKMKDSGNADASLADTEILAELDIGMDNIGNPTMTITKCDVKIGKLDMKISGTRASFLYNTVLGMFKKSIKSSLEQSLSQLITNSVNDDNTLQFF